MRLRLRFAFATVLVSGSAVWSQTVPKELESPPARPAVTGPDGRQLTGMPKFHDPLPYDIDEHTGYTQLFDGMSLAGWDGDPTIWGVEDGVMVGETLEGKPRGNSYIVYTAGRAKDFNLKLQMKIEKGGGGGIQYRSHAGEAWTRPQPPGAGAGWYTDQMAADRPAGGLLVSGAAVGGGLHGAVVQREHDAGHPGVPRTGDAGAAGAG